MTNQQKKMSIGKWLVRVLQGALIGGGAILPGVSGGVLAVTFGIYQPMIELLSHPKSALPKYYRLFIPLLLGWVLGMIFFAKAIDALYSAAPEITTWLFIGLIFGTGPALMKEAGKEGRGAKAWAGCGIGFAVLFFILIYFQHGIQISLAPTWGWFFFCGVLWGLSVVIPGMTSSSILMSLGLFQPMTSGIASLDMGVLLPMGLGILLVVLAMARAMDYMFRRHYAVAFHTVVGVVLASTVAIIPIRYTGVGQFLLCLLVAAVGFAGALLMNRFGDEEK